MLESAGTGSLVSGIWRVWVHEHVDTPDGFAVRRAVTVGDRIYALIQG
jgi:hypothetical protein